MIAIIDIGSNTVRLNVYLIEKNEFSIAFSTKEMVGLVSYVDQNKCLNQEGIHKLIMVLNDFQKTLKSLKITEIYPFATASLRNINNTQEVLNKIFEKTQLSIDLISGKQEGILGFKGATSSLSIPSALLVDIGGGSCEIVKYRHYDVQSSVSLLLGSLGLFKEFVSHILPDEVEIKKMKQLIKQEISTDKNIKKFETMVGVGGTIRALAKINMALYPNDNHPHEMSVDRVKNIIGIITNQSDFSRNILLRTVVDRIHTIIPGSLILWMIMKQYGCKKLVVSSRGAREGYLINHVLSQTGENYGE